MVAAAPSVRPGWLADNEHAGLVQDFAADHEFLQIAAGEAHGFRIALGLAHVESLGGAVDVRESIAHLLMKPLLTMPLAAWPVSSAFSDNFMRGTAPSAQPFLQGGALAARRSVTLSKPAASPSMTTHAVGGDQFSPDNAEQFVLAVAGDAGNAHDLAAADFKRYFLEPRAMRASGSSESL